MKETEANAGDNHLSIGKNFSDALPRTAGALGYTPALDGLRAWSVFAVLISHFGLGQTLSPLEKLLPWGQMGVQLFFVLSGLLITNILLNCRKNIADGAGLLQTLKAFYIRRALRIFPAYYATILLFYFFGAEEFKSVVGYHLFYLSNTVSATYNAEGFIHPASAHFWSLSVEEQFYLFWPLAVFLTPTRYLPWVGVSLVLLAPISRACLFALGYPHIMGYLPTATDALGAGALLALVKGGRFSLKGTRYVKLILILSGAGFFASILSYNFNFWYRPREIFFPLFGSIIYAGFIYLILVGRLPRVSYFFAWRPFVVIGQVSYAIYLIHTFVMNSIEYFFPEVVTLGFLRFVIGAFGTVIVAMVSWRMFEGPINQMKSRFDYPRMHALATS
jgi:peptidoglycan/LPS O-acetylase OafA/YrhL